MDPAATGAERVGASLALAYEAHAALAPYRNVLFIVCGGATATLAQIRQWQGA